MSMRLHIKLLPGAKKEGFAGTLEHGGKTYLKLGVRERPVEGRANNALIDFLNRRFKLGKGHFEIISGLTGRYKTVMIHDENEETARTIQELLH